MENSLKILISNDDGVHAKGIRTLAAALETIAEITVIAPDRDRSGASNSLTLTSPLQLITLENGYISVAGTPTDCVHLGLTGFVENNFDMIVSGINHSENLGDDVIYSGTVAAAMEGSIFGLPAVAVSLAGMNPNHFETAAQVAKDIVLRMDKGTLPPASILNVNVPDVPFNELEGFEITRLGKRHAAEPIVKREDPRGREIYWIGPPGPEQEAGPGTDFYALSRNKVSISPLQLDLTNYQAFDSLSTWLEDLF